MSIVRDVEPAELNARVARELESMIQQPEWSLFVKTGTGKERPPEQKNWYYVRGAGMLRRLYVDGPVGVQRLRTHYGSAKNLGHQPTHFRRGSGKVLGVVLQGLERAGLVEKAAKPLKGRQLSKAGKKFLDTVARSIGTGESHGQ